MEEVWAVATNTHSLLLYVCFDQCTSSCGVAVYVFVLFWVRTTSFMIQCCFRPDWVYVLYLEVVLLNISLKTFWSTSLSQTYMEFTSFTIYLSDLFTFISSTPEILRSVAPGFCFVFVMIHHHWFVDLLADYWLKACFDSFPMLQANLKSWPALSLTPDCLFFSLHHG